MKSFQEKWKIHFLISYFGSTLTKVSDWNSFWINQSYSELFRNLFPNHSESFRNNPKNVLYLFSLAKVSDRNSFRANQNYSDTFRYLCPSQCEKFRTNPKNVLYLVWWKTVKINPNKSGTKFSIRINPSSNWSRPNFQSDLIRMNPRSE